jgi:hypothetical protein
MAKRIRNAHGVQESTVPEELAAALSAARYERNGGRVGYRHGTKSRVLTGPTGPVELRRPRGRVYPPVGTTEWASASVPRYQRRRRQVNETVVATYLRVGTCGASGERWRRCSRRRRSRRVLSRGSWAPSRPLWTRGSRGPLLVSRAVQLLDGAGLGSSISPVESNGARPTAPVLRKPRTR